MRFLLLLVLLASSSIAQPGPILRERLDQCLAMLNGDPLDEGLFASSFLQAVPIQTLRSNMPMIRTEMLKGGDASLLRLERSSEYALVAIIQGDGDPLRLSLDIAPPESPDHGRITGWLLQFAPDLAMDRPKTWEAFEKALREFDATVAFEVAECTDEPTTIRAMNPDLHVAAGSTFKLYVLGAIAEHVRDKAASFDDLISMDRSLNAFPATMGMGTMTQGETISVAEACALMISISDNVATDHLIGWVGRERVEAYMSRLHPEPDRNLPFLRTIEMFRLKLGGDEAIRDEFAAGDVETRRALLDRVNTLIPQLALAQFWTSPIEIDRIEWFMSPRASAAVMRDLRRLEQIEGLDPVGDALRRNPGLDLGEGWASIAYKGGSEPGVLGMTWLLETQDGRWFTFSIGANSTEHAIDQNEFFTFAQWGVQLLREHLEQ